MTESDLKVLSALRMMIGSSSEWLRVSTNEISTATSLPERTIRRSLSRLERNNMIKRFGPYRQSFAGGCSPYITLSPQPANDMAAVCDRKLRPHVDNSSVESGRRVAAVLKLRPHVDNSSVESGRRVAADANCGHMWITPLLQSGRSMAAVPGSGRSMAAVWPQFTKVAAVFDSLSPLPPHTPPSPLSLKTSGAGLLVLETREKTSPPAPVAHATDDQQRNPRDDEPITVFLLYLTQRFPHLTNERRRKWITDHQQNIMSDPRMVLAALIKASEKENVREPERLASRMLLDGDGPSLLETTFGIRAKAAYDSWLTSRVTMPSTF